jgi:heme/copper-type cytochrome/quinol oxidase subunit 1
MPRRISDYPDAFAGWNLVSSYGSLISVVATWLFLYIVYVQLVEARGSTRYPWLTSEFYGDNLQALLNRGYDSLEWALTSPPKPHAFISLPLATALPCVHNVTGYCAYCVAAKKAVIASCVHSWSAFSSSTLIGVACDFGLPEHTAATTATTVVHVCSICQAIACSGCFAG